jgi:hypothetical protein
MLAQMHILSLPDGPMDVHGKPYGALNAYFFTTTLVSRKNAPLSNRNT